MNDWREEDGQCDFYQKEGHSEDKCWKKHRKPSVTKKDPMLNASSTNNASATECIAFAPTTPVNVTLSHEDFEHLLKLAHSDVYLPSAILANSIISHTLSLGKWLIDFGATDHMTSSSHLFVFYSPFCCPLFVSLTDGSKVLAMGKGSVLINPNLCIHDVLLVPSFPMNLLSIKKLCSTSMCQVLFSFASWRSN